MAENRCTGNCMNCHQYQRGLCSSQLAYNNMRQIDILITEVKQMNAKIDAMQNNEASVFDPNLIPNTISTSGAITQEGAGVKQ